PDYFSATGQLWGNPIYRWDKMAEDGYQWWIERFRAVFKQVDIVRLDHFRGFQAYWQVPAAEKTAINGEWIPGPGPSIFETLQHEFGELPIIAENLGLITDDVENLRKQFQFPGMRILQFAFSDPENPYLPHNYDSNTVAYTGTHDNDTTVGWWKSMGTASTLSTEQIDQVKQYAQKYINTKGEEIHWDFIRTLMGSVADMVVFPLQDILGLDSKARMNQPGKGQGNWQWRLQENTFTPQHRDRLQELTKIYGRLPEQQKGKEGEE
ncbi:4-alpha-glucanotransferase, partial [bacterium]|nr:4-alpha-glucanotransferase [bacterium]